METVHVCGACGRTVLAEYHYCPWCGAQQADGNDKEIFDKVFAQLQKLQSMDRTRRIYRMKEILDGMYRELSELGER